MQNKDQKMEYHMIFPFYEEMETSLITECKIDLFAQPELKN